MQSHCLRFFKTTFAVEKNPSLSFFKRSLSLKSYEEMEAERLKNLRRNIKKKKQRRRSTLMKSDGRRGSMSPKYGRKTYYKGKGGMKPGVNTKYGYKIVPEKLREYIVPDLTDFKLKPYVSELTPIEQPRKKFNDLRPPHSETKLDK